jgi:hypothetical protein
MLWKTKGIRRALGAPLAALAVFAGVVSPLLDSGDLHADMLLTRAQDPSSSAPSHDHRLCTQLGANQAVTSAPDVRVLANPVGVAAPIAIPPSVVPSVLADGHPTRAPPSV